MVLSNQPKKKQRVQKEIRKCGWLVLVGVFVFTSVRNRFLNPPSTGSAKALRGLPPRTASGVASASACSEARSNPDQTDLRLAGGPRGRVGGMSRRPGEPTESDVAVCWGSTQGAEATGFAEEPHHPWGKGKGATGVTPLYHPLWGLDGAPPCSSLGTTVGVPSSAPRTPRGTATGSARGGRRGDDVVLMLSCLPEQVLTKPRASLPPHSL